MSGRLCQAAIQPGWSDMNTTTDSYIWLIQSIEQYVTKSVIESFRLIFLLPNVVHISFLSTCVARLHHIFFSFPVLKWGYSLPCIGRQKISTNSIAIMLRSSLCTQSSLLLSRKLDEDFQSVKKQSFWSRALCSHLQQIVKPQERPHRPVAPFHSIWTLTFKCDKVAPRQF